jgi:hypothetical protein
MGLAALVPGIPNVNAIRRGGRAAANAGGAALKSFTKRNFRENLARTTGGVVEGAHAHHIFPQEFARRFERMGININDPGFGAWWGAGDHLGNARAYNQAWEEFLGTNPTRGQALEFGRNLARQYGLDVRF